ncbi:MAG: hypothetical protein JXR95_04365 [Deltaproteobacteria bacterium]|nr:hypothetical protein [Deltaproteobacteria bacterium]
MAIFVFQTGSRDVSLLLENEQNIYEEYEFGREVRKYHALLLSMLNEDIHILQTELDGNDPELQKITADSKNIKVQSEILPDIQTQTEKVVLTGYDLTKNNNIITPPYITPPYIVYPKIFIETLEQFYNDNRNNYPTIFIILSTMRDKMKETSNEPIAVNEVFKRALSQRFNNNLQNILETSNINDAQEFLSRAINQTGSPHVLFYNFLSGQDLLENTDWRSRINKILSSISQSKQEVFAYQKGGMPEVSTHLINSIRLYMEDRNWKLMERNLRNNQLNLIGNQDNIFQTVSIPHRLQIEENLILKYYIVKLLKNYDISGAQSIVNIFFPSGNLPPWALKISNVHQFIKGQIPVNLNWQPLLLLSQNEFSFISRHLLHIEISLKHRNYFQTLVELYTLEEQLNKADFLNQLKIEPRDVVNNYRNSITTILNSDYGEITLREHRHALMHNHIEPISQTSYNNIAAFFKAPIDINNGNYSILRSNNTQTLLTNLGIELDNFNLDNFDELIDIIIKDIKSN